MLPALNFPAYAFSITTKNQNKSIFDKIRRKYVTLTPEEWVRQHVVQYLTKEKHYAQGLIGIEQGLEVHKLQKRTDVVVYNPQGKPAMLVECKAPHVRVTNKTLEQAAAYNISLGAPYIFLTNGLKHYCIRLDFDTGDYTMLKDIPDFEHIRKTNIH